MSTSKDTVQSGMEPAHPTELYQSFERLKKEHEELKLILDQIEAKTKKIVSSQKMDVQVHMLQELRTETLRLTNELEIHSIWEEKSLYPFLQNYFDLKRGPSMLLSFWVLEKDHELAMAYLESFTRSSELLDCSATSQEYIRCAELLDQAAHILRGHFEMEEKVVYPLSEMVLTDIDYFYS